MPIWLRKFTFNSIQEDIEKQNEEIDKSKGKNSFKAPSKIKPPSFTTKARKK